MSTIYYKGSIDKNTEAAKAAEKAADYPAALVLYGDVLSESQFRIGKIHNTMGEFKKAEAFFLSCIESQGPCTAAALNSLAWGKGEQGTDKNEILSLYRQAAVRAEESHDHETRCSSLRNAGYLLWSEFGKVDEAERLYSESIRISEKRNLEKEMAGSYSDAAYFFNETDRQGKAEEYCLKAVELFQRIGDVHGLEGALRNLEQIKGESSKWKNSL